MRFVVEHCLAARQSMLSTLSNSALSTFSDGAPAASTAGTTRWRDQRPPQGAQGMRASACKPRNSPARLLSPSQSKGRLSAQQRGIDRDEEWFFFSQVNEES